jgi:hypothetical protein
MYMLLSLPPTMMLTACQGIWTEFGSIPWHYEGLRRECASKEREDVEAPNNCNNETHFLKRNGANRRTQDAK